MPASTELSAGQRSVVDHSGGPLLVLGGPGTGKTTALVSMVARRIADGADPSTVLLIAPSRRAAAAMRDRVAALVGRTIREPLARTAHSYAFGLLRREASLEGQPAPRLLAAAEQELVIRELLTAPTAAATWPADVRPALGTRAFAQQLRDLMLRALERDVGPEELARLGSAHDRPLWRHAAAFAREYAQVTALAQPSAYDPAELVRAAVEVLRSRPELAAAERSQRALLVVDDVAEADPALLDLLEVLTGGGTTMVATADPDSTVFGFRGADPSAVRDFGRRFRTAAGEPAPVHVLEESFRLPPALMVAVRGLQQRLGGRGAWRHVTPAGGRCGEVEVTVLASTSDEVAHVAARLRRRRLLDGVAWSTMAVVVRSAADLSSLRRGLARHGVPVRQRSDEVSLWQQPPVRALLSLLAIAADDRAAGPETLVDLLTGPLGRLDPARLARLRRELLADERRQQQTRSPEEILRRRVLDGHALPGGRAAPAVDALAGTIRAGRACLAAGGSVEEALWAVWEGAGVAERWRATALAGGRDGAAADRDLDAVVGLFDAAARFTDRLPGAGVAAFLDHVRAQELPGESWAAEHSAAEAVSVLTAHAAKGRQWDTVAVCRVQEDLWPDIRRRSSVLGVEDLVTVLDDGRMPSRLERTTSLLAGERRLLHLAVSRASAHLLVTAVDDGELRPSRLLEELGREAAGEAVVRAGEQPLTLAGLVAELRAVVCAEQEGGDGAGGSRGPTGTERAEAARLLAELADQGVPGASPDDWYGLAGPSDDAPLVEPGAPVSLSPSQIEGYLRCPLRWMLQRAGGEPGTTLRASVGMLVHQLASEAAEHAWSAAEVWDRYEALWATIDAGEGWVARRERSRVDAMVARLLDWMAGNERRCVGTEVDVDADVGTVHVRGRIDRLEADADGRVVVVDLKTGTTAPPASDVADHAQLGVYQWAVTAGAVQVPVPGATEGGPPAAAQAGGGLLVHLGLPQADRATEQRQPALPDSGDPDWPRRLVEQVADGVTGSTFAALVNPSCGACPVRSSCPAHADGARVAP